MKKAFLTLLVALSTTGLFAQTTLTQAVDFTVTDIHGNTHNLFDILASGQHVLIDFFFVDCGTCQAYQSQVNQVYSDFGCNAEDLFMFSMDVGDDDAYVTGYENTYNGQHPSVSGLDGGGNAVNSAYGINAYPTVILIAPDGTILEQDIWTPTTANLNSAMTAAGVQQHACTNVGVEDRATSFTGIAETYPNPTSDLATIAFGVESLTTVGFEVYDVLGSKVAEIANAEFGAGSHEVTLPVGDLTAGNYFVNLILDNAPVDVKRISVIN